ncbi:MAG: hypothetical protein WDW38_004591 [Sanguina aurantia]
MQSAGTQQSKDSHALSTLGGPDVMHREPQLDKSLASGACVSVVDTHPTRATPIPAAALWLDISGGRCPGRLISQSCAWTDLAPQPATRDCTGVDTHSNSQARLNTCCEQRDPRVQRWPPHTARQRHATHAGVST